MPNVTTYLLTKPSCLMSLVEVSMVPGAEASTLVCLTQINCGIGEDPFCSLHPISAGK